MNISSQIQTILETRLKLIPNVSLNHGFVGEKNLTKVTIITEYSDENEDESGFSVSEYTYLGFEIRVEGVLELGEDLTELYDICDEYKIALRTMKEEQLSNYVGTLGTIKTSFNKVIIDQIVKPVDFGKSLGFAVLGKVKLFQTIIKV